MKRRQNGITFGIGARPIMPVLYEPVAFVSVGADPSVAPLPDGEADTVVLRRVDAGVTALVAAQKAEEKRRKITLILTGAGVLFAAVKLGFIVIPHFRSRIST